MSRGTAISLIIGVIIGGQSVTALAMLFYMSPSMAATEENMLLELPKLGGTKDTTHTSPLNLTDEPAPAEPGAFCSCRAVVTQPTNVPAYDSY